MDLADLEDLADLTDLEDEAMDLDLVAALFLACSSTTWISPSVPATMCESSWDKVGVHGFSHGKKSGKNWPPVTSVLPSNR